MRSGLLSQKQLLDRRPGALRPRRRARRSTSPASSGRTACRRRSSASAVDDALVAEQRLKGSCPWVFAWDGTRDDVRHRLPVAVAARPAHQRAGHRRRHADRGLGADRAATSWLRADGVYDVRITAELWETHFFDHVSLLVVDHPGGHRGLRRRALLRGRAAGAGRPGGARTCAPVPRALGRTRRATSRALVAARDGRYLATFAHGALPGDRRGSLRRVRAPAASARLRRPVLLAQRLDLSDRQQHQRRDRAGRRRRGRAGCRSRRRTRTAAGESSTPDLGFPAGKNKTILIDLSARRWRAAAPAADEPRDLLGRAGAGARGSTSPLRTDATAGARRAELRYRGFSHTDLAARRRAGDAGLRSRSSTTSQRWRDLDRATTRASATCASCSTGVDDRYVIMNAGDELRLQFAGAARAADRLAARLRADRRRLGEGRRLQHRPSRRPCCRCRRTIGRRTAPASTSARAGGRSGVPAPPRRLGALSHAVRDAASAS